MTTSLLGLFLDRARQSPGAPLLDFEQHRFTAGQLAEHVTAFARGLVSRGLVPGDRVALFLENSPAFVIAYLGTWYAGGVVVLVNIQYRQVELGHILADAGARACVTGAGGAAELAPLKAQLPALEWLVTVEPLAAPVPWPSVALESFLALHSGILLVAFALALLFNVSAPPRLIHAVA